jgi:polysaccharide export outer membrane protein
MSRTFLTLLSTRCIAGLLVLGLLFGFCSHVIAQADDRRLPLAPNDLIEVKVFQEDDLQSTLRVSRAGTITFPLIGVVKVAGRTPEEAARLIRDALAKDYLVNPQVSVTVTESFKQRFTVLGQVQKPGAYDMPERDALSLLQAIGMAGGYTRIADPAKITLKRREDGRETVMKLDGKKMASGATSSSFEVRPGDVITVGESFF